jgi:hypothetical protein
MKTLLGLLLISTFSLTAFAQDAKILNKKFDVPSENASKKITPVLYKNNPVTSAFLDKKENSASNQMNSMPVANPGFASNMPCAKIDTYNYNMKCYSSGPGKVTTGNN